jgi:hypothetical protein
LQRSEKDQRRLSARAHRRRRPRGHAPTDRVGYANGPTESKAASGPGSITLMLTEVIGRRRSLTTPWHVFGESVKARGIYVHKQIERKYAA